MNEPIIKLAPPVPEAKHFDAVERERDEAAALESARTLATYEDLQRNTPMGAASYLLAHSQTIHAARAARDAARPPAAPPAPTPERLQWEELKKTSPIEAAQFLMRNRSAVFPENR